MKVMYVGPYEGVEVALPSGGAVFAEKGQAIDISKEVGESLLAQEDIWAEPKGNTAKEGK
jgi:hypothetical protein